MLFDLADDPHEMHDLIVERADDLDVKAKVRELRKVLCGVCSPEAVDARAKADQLALREETVMEPTAIKFSGDHI
jgi:hypothetical protein